MPPRTGRCLLVRPPEKAAGDAGDTVRPDLHPSVALNLGQSRMPIHAKPVKFGPFTVGGHVVALDATQRGFVVAVDERRYVLGERAQWAFATTVVLILHLFVLWGLLVTHPKSIDLPTIDQDVIQAEIYQPQPPPEPEVQPVLRLQLVPRPVPAPQPQPQPQPQKQTMAQAQPAPVPAPTPPAPAPEPARPMPQVVNRPQDTFDTPRQTTLQARADPKLQNTQAPDQALDPESKAANIKLKKKQEEELEAQQTLTASRPADLAADIKLHDAPSQSLQTVVAPSGLTPDGTHLAVGASAPPGGGAAAGGKTGIKGGRGGLSQALQNDDYCLKSQRDGKPIPGNCHMKGLTEMAAVTAKLDPHLQKEADAHAFQQKYKTTPGNDAYWKRNNVNSRPGSQLGEADDQAGAYTSDRDQRVMAGTDGDPQNSIHKTAH